MKFKYDKFMKTWVAISVLQFFKILGYKERCSGTGELAATPLELELEEAVSCPVWV